MASELHKQILAQVERLPLERQREVLDFVEFLGRKGAPPLAPRRPAPELAGLLHIRGDIIAPAIDDSDWDALR